MPAHIGFSDVLKTARNFFVTNLSQSYGCRQLCDMRKHRNGTGILSPGYLWEKVERTQERTEQRFESYDRFRAVLDTYDPNIVVPEGQINTRECDPTEWELYLRPGTEFDQVCGQYFDDYPDGQIIIITHKKRVQAL